VGEHSFRDVGAACHVHGAGEVAPSPDGPSGTEVQLADGSTVVADETYIRESITDPGAWLVGGFQPLMPKGGDRLTEDELEARVAYLESRSP